MKKIKIYSSIREEAGVVMVFSKIHEQLGFPKLVSASARGFDIDDIEYHDDLGTHRVTVEFEYYSSSFIGHGHPNYMQEDRKYIVICYEDDCNLEKLIYEKYQKSLYKVIELKDYIEIIPDEIIESSSKPNYYLINYNPSNADYRGFEDWIYSNMYSFSNNMNTIVKNGSKALIKQGNYIIGGFDIVRFLNLKISSNSEVIHLYKALTDYPVSIFSRTEEEIINTLVGKNIGHIFYNNFFLMDQNTIIRKTVQELLPELKFRHSAIQHLTEEQYHTLLGIKK